MSRFLPVQVRPVTRVISVTDWSSIDQISQHLFFYSLSLVSFGSLAARILTFTLGKASPDYLGNEWLIRARCCTFILDQICRPNDRREVHLCIFGHVLSLVSYSSTNNIVHQSFKGVTRGFTLNQPLQINHLFQPNCSAVQRINPQQIDNLSRLNVQCFSLAFPSSGWMFQCLAGCQKDAAVTIIDPDDATPSWFFHQSLLSRSTPAPP